jgi:hypothetical protein
MKKCNFLQLKYCSDFHHTYFFSDRSANQLKWLFLYHHYAFPIMVSVTVFILANFLYLQFLQSESSKQPAQNILLSDWGMWKFRDFAFQDPGLNHGMVCEKGAIPFLPNQTPRYQAHLIIPELIPHPYEIS